MRQAAQMLAFQTPGPGLLEITRDVAGWASGQGMATGLLTLFCRHTSTSLLIQENAASAARRDLETWFARVVPEDRALYTHNDEGPDDMPAHIRAALTSTQLSVPIVNRRMALGTWQGIYLFEHRREPSRREFALHLIGE